MAEYYSSEDVKDFIRSYRHSTDVVFHMEKHIKEIPAADVRPVVRAVWRRYSPFTDTYECSNCGEQVIDQQFRTNFCSDCGADMRPKPPKEKT